jgi:hypothetical protein
MPLTSHISQASKISGAGGYFAVPGSNPPRAGAFVPKKAANKKDNIFGDSQKEKTSSGY